MLLRLGRLLSSRDSPWRDDSAALGESHLGWAKPSVAAQGSPPPARIRALAVSIPRWLVGAKWGRNSPVSSPSSCAIRLDGFSFDTSCLSSGMSLFRAKHNTVPAANQLNELVRCLRGQISTSAPRSSCAHLEEIRPSAMGLFRPVPAGLGPVGRWIKASCRPTSSTSFAIRSTHATRSFLFFTV